MFPGPVVPYIREAGFAIRTPWYTPPSPRTAGDNDHLPVADEQLTQQFMRHRHALSPAQNGRWRTILNTQA
jgi:hypothetical protein